MTYHPLRLWVSIRPMPLRRHKRRSALAAFGVLCGVMFSLSSGGCSGLLWGENSPKKAELGVDAKDAPLSGSAAVRDTIGAYTYYDGLAPLRVTGFGLVVGLGSNGSRDCPKDIYGELIQSLYKRQRSAISVVGVPSLKPETLIDSLDSAVVVVQGDIPPAATAGKRFEISVTALPGTKTKSLRGGYLLPTELARVQPTGRNRAITGKVLAQAYGPLLLNPFVEADSASRTAELQGTVVGGGMSKTDRLVRLVLTSPSYPLARQVRDRINDHFPGPKRVADAISPSFVELRCPEDYRDDEAHFLGLVRGLYLSRNPQFEAERARALADELLDAAAPHAMISWCLEGLGATALPILRDLYAHPEPHVAFHAAAAGLRLDDHLAGDLMATIADQMDNPFRFRAIRALGAAEGMANAVHALRRLLGDDDPRVRVAAYEALLKRRDTAVESIRLGRDNFVLDRVSVPGEKLVYAKRSGERRIALFGRDIRCSAPAFYRSPDGSLTITAEMSDNHLTLLRTVLLSGNVSPPIASDFDVGSMIQLLGRPPGVDFDGNVTGLGIDYGSVAHALYSLCRDHVIDADFMTEQPNIAELFGPSQISGRPEAE